MILCPECEVLMDSVHRLEVEGDRIKEESFICPKCNRTEIKRWH